MKVLIVMTYYNRQYQLDQTLHSIEGSKHNDFEVVIVDDSSDKPIDRIDVSFPVTVLRTENKKWSSPCVAFNVGFSHAMKLNPDIVIMQNAECYHVGDVISYAAANTTDEVYIAFSCFSLNEYYTFREHNIFQLIDENKRRAKYDGDMAWYNHPMYRPNAFNFCTSITVKNLKKINGFEERFSDGWGYEDNYLVDQVKMLGLRIEIPTDPFVVHQWHYSKELPADYIRRSAKSKLLLVKLRNERTIRSKHIYTPNL